jgi:hypothetical protein
MESAIAWRGKSRLDGVTDVTLIVTGITHKSGNAKTGAMVQTYILVSDITPKKAIDTGVDIGICGKCPHRKFAVEMVDGVVHQTEQPRECYVNLATGLNVVGRQMLAGRYQVADLEQVALACAGLSVRLGTYGDPAAVPIHVWRTLTRHAKNWTGYTHQWRENGMEDYKEFCMASCDSEQDRLDAKRVGWRTFRVRSVKELTDGSANTMPGEIRCPASAEAGKVTTCDRCGLCAGTTKKAKDIVIINHSTRANAARRKLSVIQ